MAVNLWKMLPNSFVINRLGPSKPIFRPTSAPYLFIYFFLSFQEKIVPYFSSHRPMFQTSWGYEVTRKLRYFAPNSQNSFWILLDWSINCRVVKRTGRGS